MQSLIILKISTRRIRTCQVVVDKLPPLHQHMSDRLQRNIFVLVNYCAYQSRAGKRPSGYRSPDTLNSIPVNRWQESDEQKSLSTFREIDLSNISRIYIYISIPRVSSESPFHRGHGRAPPEMLQVVTASIGRSVPQTSRWTVWNSSVRAATSEWIALTPA